MRQVIEIAELAPAHHAEAASHSRLPEPAQRAAADRAAASMELPAPCGGLQGSVSRQGTRRCRGGS